VKTIDLSRIGRVEKTETIIDRIRDCKPGDLLHFDYGERETKISRWAAVNRRRTGKKIRFSRVAIDRIAYDLDEVSPGADGTVALETASRTKFFRVRDGSAVPLPVKEAPLLDGSNYVLWVAREDA
jgi:hypothetical protein